MLRSRAVSATFWSTSDVLLRQGLQFLTVMVLARLLDPADFGVIAILYIFTGVASTLVDGGLSTALIQNQQTTTEDESTVFWINVFSGFLVALLFIAFSARIAVAFDLPQLSGLTVLMGLSVFAASFGVVQLALLTKRLDFRRQLLAGVAAALVSGASSIVCAAKGFGVWSLAVQVLSMSTSYSLFLWLLGSWRPRARFSARSVSKLFRFSGYVLAANLIDMIYTRAYTLVIGRYIGIAELGFYDRAEQTKQLPANFIAAVLGRIILPLFSEVSRDTQKLRDGMRLSIRGLMLLNLPLMLLLAATAEPFILTLFGAKWVQTVVPFRVLCIAAALWPLHVVNVNAFLAQGQSRLVFKLEFPKKILGLSLLFAGIFFGIEGVAWSQVVFSMIAFVINAYCSGKAFKYGIVMQAADIAGPLMLSVGVALPAFAMSSWLALAPALECLLIWSIAGAAYLWIGYALKIQAFYDAAALFSNLRSKSESEGKSNGA